MDVLRLCIEKSILETFWRTIDAPDDCIYSCNCFWTRPTCIRKYKIISILFLIVSVTHINFVLQNLTTLESFDRAMKNENPYNVGKRANWEQGIEFT